MIFSISVIATISATETGGTRRNITMGRGLKPVPKKFPMDFEGCQSTKSIITRTDIITSMANTSFDNSVRTGVIRAGMGTAGAETGMAEDGSVMAGL